jgi:ribosomal protein S18 acetylase RimI-like enzyme
MYREDCQQHADRKKEQRAMQEIVDDFLPSTVIKAIETNVQDAWIYLGRGLGAEIHDEPEMVWFFSGIPFHLANGVVRANFFPDAGEEILNERLEQLTSHGVPMAWLIGPSTHPTDLGSYLERHGWSPDEEAPGMALDLQTLDAHLSLPPHVTIERVTDTEKLKTWLRILFVGSELPEEGLMLLLEMVSKRDFNENAPVHYYLGLLDDRPVATSMLYRGGGVAGIYNVTTLPDARRQGIGSVLTLASLVDARAWGYQIAILQSTQMGINIYRRLGFREYCTFYVYFWSGEQSVEQS